jgi:YggT family protein
MYIIRTIIVTLANILSFVIIADALLSWILPPYNSIREALGRVLQPLYGPVRRLVPPLGGIDFTPVVALVLIQVIEQIILMIVR